MHIKPPYGFQEIVALSKTHQILLPKESKLPVVFRTMNPIPVSYSEFMLASRDYPLVFISSDLGKSFAPMLVLGFDAKQNLYTAADDTWDTHSYVPAYVRRYPFCMTRVWVDGKESSERVACVEKRAITRRGEKLFDADGKALPVWEQRQKLLFEYESDLARTEAMCALLAQHGLFEPFTLQAVPDQGEPLQLGGMYRVAEARLADLDAALLKELVQLGILGRIYTHLLSLENFQRLLARCAAR